jgi:MoaA/NifB/PqqE/SkfB family radical SAM enzyme
MKRALPLLAEPPAGVPAAPFLHLAALWIQITGTWCNLECTHCLNASGPKEPWLRAMDASAVRRALAEADALGVKEIYFTGGEPFLHRDILPLLAESLRVAPTTVLTNGTLVTPALADALAALAAAARYSLEVRVSLDDVDETRNDRVRGAGAWRRAVRAIRLLDERGLLPIVTATEVLTAEHADGRTTYDRFREFLGTLDVAKPRVKVMPVFAVGRLEDGEAEPLDEAALADFDRGLLQCASSRVLAADGVYACPILAGLPGARLSGESLRDALRPAALYHPACVTCYRTGMSCRNA